MPTTKEPIPVPDYFAPEKVDITHGAVNSAVTYTLRDGSTFTITGESETVMEQLDIAKAEAQRLDALDERKAARRHKVAAVALKPATRPENGSQAPMVQYQPMTIKTKIRDWLSDREWAKVDKELGLSGTDLSIVRERQEQRLANRILVARIAAGVDKPPVWGKHKVALKLAERALSE